MRLRPLTVVALAALVAPALAFQNPEGVWLGREPARVRTTDRTMQSVLASTPAWKAFVADEGRGWSVRWDETTRTPHRMWGPGLDLGPLRSRADVERAIMDFTLRHADLLGLGAAVPVVRDATYVPSMDAWYADVDTEFSDMPVWRGGITFRIAHGRLVMVGADTYPDVPFVGALTLSATDAIGAFEHDGPAPRSEHTDASATPVLLPEVVAGRAQLRVVWHVRTRTEDPPGRWHGFVDADTGELVAFYNDVRYLDGTLTSDVDARIGDGTLESWPLRNATLTDDAGDLLSSEDGTWSDDGTTAPTLALDGPRLRIVEKGGTPTPTIDAGDRHVTAADFDDHQADLSSFNFVQRVQDYAATLDPDVAWVTERAITNVNIDDTCNAYWDGSLNFFAEGGGCRNSGRLADVVFHEWGHGFHYTSILSGDFDGSLGEGAADVMATLMTDDHRLSPNFFLDRATPLRDVQNHARWPDDYVNDEAFVHENGLIFGGAMWDTRQALQRDYGTDTGKQIVAHIYTGLLKGGPDTETAYDEAVFADDDDANLGNGTPHRCQIVEGFGLHGLGPEGGFGIAPTYDGPWMSPAGSETALALTVGNPAPECLDVEPTAGTMHWRADNGAWQTLPMTVDAQDVTATIPKASLHMGDVVSWWDEIETNEGGTVLEPSSGEIKPHTFYVGDALPLGCTDFEKDDGGFTHALVRGTDVEGADDWAWGAPAGLAGDPAAAASGKREWGTDLGGEKYNGQYQNDKYTRLSSPAYDTAWYKGVVLRYARWLTVEDGQYDTARIVADDDVVWSNWASTGDQGDQHTLDDRWETHVVGLDGQGDDGSVTISWEMQTDQGLSFGGWNIDDVCLFAPATADNRLGIGDFTATRKDDGVHLGWTNPKWAPVERVRVVRAVGRWPKGADDGAIVFETDHPELGAAAAATDDVSRKNLYYAVYAYDGTDWLSWTRQGLNAASVEPVGAPGGACGCATSAPLPPGLGVLAGLALLRRRQRRRGED